MQFRDFSSADAHYAARYAEYAAGRLPAAQLDAERAALLVLDPHGAPWRKDPTGRWVPEVPARRRGPGRWLAAGAAVLVLLAGVGLAAGGRERETGLETTGRERAAAAPGLAGVLQGGGVVVYLRHAERTETPEEVTDPADCSTQANLTEAGREQARRTGAALRALGVRVRTVTASPYCRTRETAELAFGAAPTLLPVLAGASLVPPVPQDEQREAVLELLGAAPPDGLVDVVVGHGEVLQAAAGGGALGFAELAVFRDGTTELGRLTHEQLVAAACSGGRC